MADDLNDWSWWQGAVAGERGELTRGDPKSGFYRFSDRAVSLWRDETGSLMCWVSSGYCPRKPDEIDDLFGFCCTHPISHEAFVAFTESGVWPEDVAAPVRDRSLSPADAVKAQVAALKAEADAWLKGIGKIETQEHADKASNFADRFAELEKKAVAEHKVAKEPSLTTGREIDALWKPIIAAGDEAKRFMKKALEPFLTARKQAAEAAAAAARTANPGVAVAAVNPKAGTRRAVAMRTRTIVKITDFRTAVEFLAKRNEPAAELVDAVRVVAQRMLLAGVEVPGAEMVTESYAA